MADMATIVRRVQSLRANHAERDARHQTVYDVRANKIDRVQPGSLPDAWPKPIVANAIDTAARQLAENLAPLPSINCATGVTTSDRAKKFVAKKTKIAYSFVIDSALKAKMPQGCDWYLTYGSLPMIVEPDFKEGKPRIRFDNPRGSYPQFDLWGNVIAYAKVYRERAGELAAKFPAAANQIYDVNYAGQRTISDDALLEVVKYIDGDVSLLYLPERKNYPLLQADNPLGKCPVRIAVKPSYDEQDRGQFDDVIYPHLARARMEMLALEATQQAVRAPLALPSDVQRISFGDNAVVRTSSPEKIRRVGQDIPVVAFQEGQVLAEEVRAGTRTPASATGDVSASIITGQGVNALNGGYDIQIATGQTAIGYALEQALALCFEMDEKFWPEARKTVTGVINGTPFQETYVPGKDIRGDYRVSVTYGFASGMNPNQALVFLLQLRGDQLVSRDFVQRQLPMDIDVTALQAQIDNEQVTDALKQGIFGMLSSVGIMAQQGMDPTQILRNAAQIVALREKGVPMDQAILQTFEAPPPPSPAAGGPSAPGGEGQPGALMGQNPTTGSPYGVAAGQAQMGPGGRPPHQQQHAGLTGSGKPDLAASVRRSVPA
ncbi:MAG: hypothetical protein ACTHON_15090 [Humibacter sp.]